ncbi:1-acyl-sn-glycerol-3-phosphate acyltransferase [Altererythrobacter atlanticus]|uniref:2-acyl-glycerophospho-ethanolamine acyltransferase n=1 Tax=Croceibacterium atlanticum TaxID=1267766 RepID=A0A0F7KX65_9SPHN|nr:lysophospholipid acyltransferase family protein [Croceibacterium atlanticum]AKH43796.1 2-acyl-glycerophospho-ethanolamine acyltransferase [Croceibacterium atlanticum]MBB5733754.1 1-acyl-sn-glycerol-3-phosphate acyltransferase [Croceibacterium atlanticum]
MLRSLLFYVAFYGGTVPYLVVSMLALLLAPGRLVPVATSWSHYHRFCLRYFAGIRVREEGERPEGPAIFAFKHESFFEAIDLPVSLDYPVIFAKEELFRIPGWGRAARAYGAIPLARRDGAKALRRMLVDARNYTKGGRPLVIFPEGTRVPHGHVAPLKSGFAALYKLLGVPVVPVAVDSGLLYQRRWKRPGTITIRFGEAIEPGLPRPEIEARVTQAINVLNSVDP